MGVLIENLQSCAFLLGDGVTPSVGVLIENRDIIFSLSHSLVTPSVGVLIEIIPADSGTLKSY